MLGDRTRMVLPEPYFQHTSAARRLVGTQRLT
jgi:hypothetical protein